MSSKPNISPSQMESRIAELREEIDSQESKVDRLRTELQWWEDGKNLFGRSKPPTSQGQASAPTEAGQNGKLTLRQAILAIMREQPKKTWRTEVILKELEVRDQLPNGEYGMHHGRSMLSNMARKGQIRRTGRGQYRLKESSQDQML